MKCDIWLHDGRVINNVSYDVFDECMEHVMREMILYGQKYFDSYIVSHANDLQEDIDEYSI